MTGKKKEVTVVLVMLHPQAKQSECCVTLTSSVSHNTWAYYITPPWAMKVLHNTAADSDT
jgi:hypothetical protein